MSHNERRQIFARNLRLLCQSQKSVSEVARQIGINRHQFERYLKGKALPSINTQYQIAQYFGVPTETLLKRNQATDWLPPQVQRTHGSQGVDVLGNSSAHELSRLRKYQGIYHAHFVSPAFPSYIHVGVALIREQDHRMRSVFFVRSRSPDTNIVHRSHLYGVVLLRGERVFIIESSKQACDRFSETILYPSHGDKMKYMTGMCIGLTWHPEAEPYASRTIWRRAAVSVSLRQAVRGCGLYHPTSPNIDPVVRNFFGDIDNLSQSNSLSATRSNKLIM